MLTENLSAKTEDIVTDVGLCFVVGYRRPSWTGLEYAVI
jgi:hypothetical protein